MRFVSTPLGAVLLVVLLSCVVLLGAAVVRVDRTTRPPRRPPEQLDFDSLMLRVEEVQLSATDGVRLNGWWLPGQPGQAAVILGHDVGATKTSLVDLAAELGKQGLPRLLIDFRGHGASAGGRSTLGLLEKRDILGAVEFIEARAGIDARRIGVYGVGMGAHAAVLAAADCPALKVLVLDSLYPDVGFVLDRELYAGWEFGRRNLGFVSRGIFAVLHGGRSGRERAADELSHLLGRDVLLVALESDPMLTAEIKSMYETIPEQIDVDGNLLLLPATQAVGLYGNERTLYQERVARFFRHRLSGP